MLGAMKNSSHHQACNLWRHVLVLFLVFGSLIFTMMQAPVRQDLAYHAFSDSRMLFGIPNFYNVVSNLPFLIVGVSGSIFCYREVSDCSRMAWLGFFVGIAFVALGSSFYHLEPGNWRLFWDRLPMTMGFMGLFAALLGELVNPGLATRLLLPLILMGIASSLIWHWYDDLRFYIWVQFMPLLVIPVLLALYRKRYSHYYFIVLGLLFYLLAKLLEICDAEIFSLFENEMAGHAIKHVFAAMGSAVILWMLRVRKPLA